MRVIQISIFLCTHTGNSTGCVRLWWVSTVVSLTFQCDWVSDSNQYILVYTLNSLCYCGGSVQCVQPHFSVTEWVIQISIFLCTLLGTMMWLQWSVGVSDTHLSVHSFSVLTAGTVPSMCTQEYTDLNHPHSVTLKWGEGEVRSRRVDPLQSNTTGTVPSMCTQEYTDLNHPHSVTLKWGEGEVRSRRVLTHCAV